MKYKMKLAQVNAWQFGESGMRNKPEWIEKLFKQDRLMFLNNDLVYRNKGKMIYVSPSDWIVESENEEIYVFTDRYFKAIFEEIN